MEGRGVAREKRVAGWGGEKKVERREMGSRKEGREKQTGRVDRKWEGMGKQNECQREVEGGERKADGERGKD
jgi:hypothetical protein